MIYLTMEVWKWLKKKKPEAEEVPPVMEWVESKYCLPAPNSGSRFLIYHCNGFMEVARRQGNSWWSISKRCSEEDLKLNHFSQPDYWMEIKPPGSQ